MKSNLKLTLALLFLFLSGCSIRKEGEMAKVNQTIFPLGSEVKNGNFTGQVWLQMLVLSDTTYNSNIGSVTFAPAARSNWHYHPGGQLLLVTEGIGLYQEKGKAIEIIKKGEVVKCKPNVIHWHGATANSKMTHIAIGTNTQKGNVVWLAPVDDATYFSVDNLKEQ